MPTITRIDLNKLLKSMRKKSRNITFVYYIEQNENTKSI